MTTGVGIPSSATQYELDPEDVVLCILEAYERLFGRKKFSGITRLEKLIFLLQHETKFQGAVDLFKFRPYNFGPFSKEVYEALDFLSGIGFVSVSERTYRSIYVTQEEHELTTEISDEFSIESDDDVSDAGASEKVFALTDNGRSVARRLRAGFAATRPQDVDDLEDIVRRYARLPLGQLIRYVYRRYPDMTTKSIHPAARRNRGATG